MSCLRETRPYVRAWGAVTQAYPGGNLTSPKSLTLERVNIRCVNRQPFERPVASNHFCAGARAATGSSSQRARTHFVVDNPNRHVYNASQQGREHLPDCRER